MNLFEAIAHRRAIRDFTTRPVEKELIQSLIGTAILAPNSMNRQAWAFVVVSDRKLLQACSDAAKAHLLETLDPSSDIARHRSDRLRSAEFNIFYNAPALVIVCATSTQHFIDHDCCLAAGHLMLAAHAQGLGTCWIGFAEDWLNQPDGKRMMGIPADYTVIAPVILGYPQAQPPRTPRHAPAIHWIG